MNEENPRATTGDGIPNYGVTRNITRVEVTRAMKKMKNAKAVGPDKIPVEAWISRQSWTQAWTN